MSKPKSSAKLGTHMVSCGVLLFNHRRELLVAHVTGQDWWDVPKGLLDEGELPRLAAVREVREESGIELYAPSLVEIGRVKYLPEKSLHLFAAPWPHEALDLSVCKCSTYFRCRKTGSLRPEVDAFRWVAFGDIPQYCGRSLSRALLTELELDRIAESVQFDMHT